MHKFVLHAGLRFGVSFHYSGQAGVATEHLSVV